MKLRMISGLWRVALLLAVFAIPAYAAVQPDLPITMPSAGKFACPTCVTEAAGVNPLAVADLPNLTSAEWASHTTDETGSGALCFATSPSLVTPAIAGATLTGTIDATGATLDLAAGTVDDIGEIDNTILGGGASHGPKLATQESSPTANRCARFDANGVLVAHSGDCSTSTPIKSVIFSEAQFPIPAGDVNTFMSLGGRISDTSAPSQSLVHENMTVGGCCCVYQGTPGTGVVFTLGSGTYGGTMTGSSIAITCTTTNVPVCDADTLALTANQGANWLIDGASDTGADGQVACTCNRIS